MQPQNLAEYKQIREELIDLKNCITNYVGFFLAASATGIISLLVKEKKLEEFPAYATATILSPLIMVFVLRVLFYKFQSHNRYAGYCKLLTQERFTMAKWDSEIHLWEACMAILRKSDADNSELVEYSKKIESKIPILVNPNWAETVKSYSGPEQPVEKWEGVKGLKLFLVTSYLRRGPHWLSWGFPVPIVGIFFVTTIVFFGAWLYFLVVACRWLPMDKTVWLLSHVPILGFLVIDWNRFLGKLYKIMKGSLTVDAFCYKFLPIRYALLSQHGGVSNYRLIGVNLS